MVDETPPGKPDAGVTANQAQSTFAIQTLFLGEADRAGGYPTSSAWRQFGYDLDGLITARDSTVVCTLAPGAPHTNQIDGDGGIDNAWGSVLVPLVQVGASEPTPSNDGTALVDSGAWTLLIQITGLSADPHQTAVGLDAQVFVGATTQGPPAFDSTTDWPVRPSSLNDGATLASGAAVHFTNVYVVNGMVVAMGAERPLALPMLLLVHYNGPDGGPPPPPRPVELRVRVHHAILTFDHTDPTTAANGTIAGVLDTAESLEAGVSFAETGNALFCAGNALDALALQIGQAQDILADGTNTPGVACNAISIGIGFTAKLVANPTTVGTDPAVSDPCGTSDAGTD